MKKLGINSANIRVSVDSIIFDTGDLPQVTIVVEDGISLRYCFVPSLG